MQQGERPRKRVVWMGSNREIAKLALRRILQRANLGVSRDPAMKRLVRTLESLSVDTVLDVGANEGQFAALLRSAGFGGRIESFEPLPDAFAALERRVVKDKAWRAHRCALGEDVGVTTINVSQNSYSSSILDMTSTHLRAAPESRVIGKIEVPLQRLEDLAADLDVVPSRTLLKVDTQGYERQVLRGASSLMGDIAALQLELSMVTLYSGQVLFDEMRALLANQGLRLVSLEPGISDDRGWMLQCDGVFVRDSLDI